MKSTHSLANLNRFMQRTDWRPAFDEVFEEHFGPVCDEYGLHPDNLASLLGDVHYLTLWGCAFEDLLTRRFEGGRNLVDEYLKRRGWNESATNKTYMAGLRDSVMSLYEVSNVVPGQSMDLRDLLEARAPVTVQEKTATRTLKQWDHIAARLVPMRRTTVIAGGLLAFTREASERARAIYAQIGRTSPDELAEIAEVYGLNLDGDRFAESLAAGEVQQHAARILTAVWLDDTLQGMLNPAPLNVCNSDGDPLLFTSVHYPLQADARPEQVRAALARLPDLHPDTDDCWTWFENAAPPARASQSTGAAAHQVETDMATDRGTVLGTVELKRDRLTLETNAQARAHLGRAMIEPVLGDLVRQPLVETQSVEQLMQTHGRSGAPAPDPALPPEVAEKAVHEALDRRYRETLDEPVPMLNDLSPREAARRPDTRAMVADWLKYLENANARQPADSPMASYDIGWMWAELGVSDLRR